jgi:hypothetical protein
VWLKWGKLLLFVITKQYGPEVNYLSTILWSDKREWRYGSAILYRQLYPRCSSDKKLGGPQSRSGRCGEETNVAMPSIEPRPSSPSLYQLLYPDFMCIVNHFLYISHQTSHIHIKLYQYSQNKHDTLKEKIACWFVTCYIIYIHATVNNSLRNYVMTTASLTLCLYTIEGRQYLLHIIALQGHTGVTVQLKILAVTLKVLETLPHSY